MRALGGSQHACVGFAFEGFIERAGAGGDEADAEEGIEEAGLEARYAGLHGAEIETSPTGDEYHADDLDLEQLAQVLNERSGGTGGGSVDVRRCVGQSIGGGNGNFGQRGL
jgi:hypothetical protein